MFFEVIFTMNIFVALIDMGILSKQKMFKTDVSFDSKYLQVFALYLALISWDFQKNIIFHVLFGFCLQDYY